MRSFTPVVRRGVNPDQLLLTPLTSQVDVYEMRDSIPSNPQESYPIGLNPRGVRAMDRANRDIALAIRNQCFMVDGWKILAGRVHEVTDAAYKERTIVC